MTTEGEKERFLRLLMLEENEAKRIAKELHHDLRQSLEMIKHGLEVGIQQIKDNQVKLGIKSLDNLSSKIRQAIDQIQKIGFYLWPPTLDNAHLGILPTISWFCREFQEAHSSIRIDVQVDIQEDEVHDFLKPTIYKILREALNNAQYSKASLVHVFLLRRDLRLELTIQDDGEGFDMEKEGFTTSRLALSLDGMKERTDITGGSFSIESVIGKGATIRALWPRTKVFKLPQSE
jgi:signal transduction histidine kinase